MTFRSAGSHTFADIIAVKPLKDCLRGDHFEVKFIQVKVSDKYKKDNHAIRVEETPIGLVNVDYYVYRAKERASRKKKRVVNSRAKREVRLRGLGSQPH